MNLKKNITIPIIYLISIFLIFRLIGSKDLDETSNAVRGILRNEYNQANSYLISKSLADLEKLNLITCVKLAEEGALTRIYYNTTSRRYCFSENSLLSLINHEINFSAINGLQYQLNFRIPYTWKSILTELFFYIFGLIVIRLFLIISAKKEEIIETKISLAKQVAHDIRSPVSALSMLRTMIKLPDDNHVKMLEMATNRIIEISNDLLSRSKPTAQLIESIKLKPLISDIIDEKRLEHGNIASLEIVEDFCNKEDYCGKANPVELKRILSNLINNSVEAVNHSNLKIILKIKRNNNSSVSIIVIDNGKGIPQKILKNLGQKGISFGKINTKSGSGLGIYGAKKCIESWNGKLNISSSVGNGTAIEIMLGSDICEKQTASITSEVLLDDDELTRTIWESKAQALGIDLITFSCPNELLSKISDFSTETTFYIDSELDNDLKGENFAKHLFDLGFQNLIMASGHERSHFDNIHWIKNVVGKKPPWS